MGQATKYPTPLPLGITMSKKPFELQLRYSSVDTRDYPKTAQSISSSTFKKHLRIQLEKQYQSLGGELQLKFADDHVQIKWQKDELIDEKKQQAMMLLQSGDLTRATPILSAILDSDPTDTDTLYNLGMVYSDQGKLEDAIVLLSKATESDSEHSHAFVALGVAYLRQGNLKQAEKALKQSLSIDSDDPYALRTLATLHMQEQDYIPAISILRHSLSLLPSDSISLFNLAMCLFQTGQKKNIDEAGEITNALIMSNKGNEIEEKAKDLQRQIGYKKFRDNSGEHENSDAVFYCIDALRKLKDLNKKEIAAIALEIAQLGQNGLSINDSKSTYTIKSLSGQFSGLALVCLLHTAIQKVSPESDSGFDVQKEYEIAKNLFDKKQA